MKGRDSYDNAELVEYVARRICRAMGENPDSSVVPADYQFRKIHGLTEIPGNLPIRPLWQHAAEEAVEAIAAVRNWDYLKDREDAGLPTP